jgi:mono/diheme cytochrome c family protein/plastocyanin
MSRTTKQIIAMLGLAFVLILGCGAYTVIEPTRADNQEDYRVWQSVERGAETFAQNCRTCHGNSGQGGVGPPLNIEANRPEDNPVALEALRDRYAHTITCGRVGTVMPAWGQAIELGGASVSIGGSLTDNQIQQLVNLITSPQFSEKGWEEAAHLAEEIDHELEAQGFEPPEPVLVTNLGPCLDPLIPGGVNSLLTPQAPATPDPDATPETAPEIAAENSQSFTRDTMLVPAGEAFEVTFTNNEANVPHNWALYVSQGGEAIAQGEIITGPASETIPVDALDPGDYFFVCDVHPNMTGTLSAVE